MKNVDLLRQSGHYFKHQLRDEFDSVIVGVTTGPEPKLVYSYNGMITVLMEENNWDIEKAESYLMGVMSLHEGDVIFMHGLKQVT